VVAVLASGSVLGLTSVARTSNIVPTYWMFSLGHLKTLEAAGMSPTVAKSFADTPNSIFNLTVGHQTTAKVATIHAAYPLAQVDALFNSEADIAAAFAARTIPPGLQAIAYDPEGIAATPLAEQAALGAGDTSYVSRAIALAHSHGLKLYFIPSVDVGMTGGQGSYPTKYTTWLSEHRGRWAALGEDLYSIQSQQAEGTPTFAGFVPTALAQAHAAAPGVPIDIGIGINPHNPPTCITTQEIIQAYDIGRVNGAAGYWNNVETGVNCNVPTSVYVAFFKDLYLLASGLATTSAPTTTVASVSSVTSMTTAKPSTTASPLTTTTVPGVKVPALPCVVEFPGGLKLGRCTGTFIG
jgi:hypothetical protein